MRERIRLVRWSGLFAYVGLDLVMNRPAYFLISDIDLTGGSTSWHRAQLIRSAFEHVGEWWLVGTDYTRHWMPTGVPSSPNQTDITNHYIAMGILGGLPLMLLFMGIFVGGFAQIGRAIRSATIDGKAFACWAVGASLFAHAVTCLSVSYYDTSVMFLYLTIAATAATVSSHSVRESASAGLSASVASAPQISRYGRMRTRARIAPTRMVASSTVQRFYRSAGAKRHG
jgi:hypothetical protein